MKVLEKLCFHKRFGIQKMIRKKVVLKDPITEKNRKFSPETKTQMIKVFLLNNFFFFLFSHLFNSNRDTQQKGLEAHVAQGILCLCLVFNHLISTLLTPNIS